MAGVVLFTFSAWVAVLQMQLVKAVLFCERKEPFGMRTMVFKAGDFLQERET